MTFQDVGILPNGLDSSSHPNPSLQRLVPISTCPRRGSSSSPPIPQRIFPITADTDVNPPLMNTHDWQFPNIMLPYHFTCEQDLHTLLLCHWMHSSSSITAKCVFISTFLLHPYRILQNIFPSPWKFHNICSHHHGIPVESTGSLVVLYSKHIWGSFHK